MSLGFLKKLSDLQTLHVTFNQSHFNSREAAIIGTELPLWKMQVLPLKHVTVVIGDEQISQPPKFMRRYPHTLLPRGRWTIEKKREVAEGLRLKLLDPNGSEVFAAERTAQRAARKEVKEMEEAKKVVCMAEREE